MESLKARVAAHLAALRQEQLLRTLQPPRGVDLCSNDYLGLSGHPLLKERMMAAVARDGCGSTGSRLLRGERDAFSRVERQFAAFKQAERAVYFSSGYLANLAVMSTLPEAGDVIFSDARNHASLIDGIRLSRARRVVFAHNDATGLEALLAAADARHAFVVVESLFSMDGDLAPLADYAARCRRFGATLVVDEAHAVGVFGARGSGLVEAHGLEANDCVTINTAGKALGVSGAFVAGPAWMVEYLVQRARPFVFSTAPPPAVADALEAALAIVAAEPERRARLHHLARHLRARLSAAGLACPAGVSPIVPIVLGSNERALSVARALQAEGFDVRAIRPPSVPPGTARLRVTVNVTLDEAILDRFAAALASAVAEVPCAASS